MSRSPLSPWEILPIFIMLALGGRNLEPWMRRFIDMVNGTQNTVKEMQRGINTFHGAVYQMMIPPDSSTPREKPEAEFNSHPPENDQLPQLTDDQPVTKGDTYNTLPPGTNEINTSTAIEPPPSVLPAGMPTKSDH